MTPERARQLGNLAARLGHEFTDLKLLERALTHASLANEDAARVLRDNEPLEFLGDAVLGLIAAALLHRRDPEGAEGRKSRLKARLVSSANLARHAADLGIPDLLHLGRGEEKTGGRQKRALWADAYESVIAALYLDGGLSAAERHVQQVLLEDLVHEDRLNEADHKSRLQELLQGGGRPIPDYVVEAEEGPSHRRHYRIRCCIDGQVVSEGTGFSKKEAQQEAARLALEALATPATDRGADPSSRD